jgi:DNA repair protein RadD
VIFKDLAYQLDIIERTRAALARSRAALVISPTGSGKTVLTGKMLGGSAARGSSSWFVVHRRELVKQSIRTFTGLELDFGVVAAGFQERRAAPIQIASQGTLAKRWRGLRTPALVAWDEAHHLAAASWETIYTGLPRAFHVGLTATGERPDGRGLGKFFKEIVQGPSVKWLIENGYLTPYRLVVPPDCVNVSSVHTKMGDYVKSELAAVADRPTVTGSAVKQYLKHAAGRRAIAFCVSVEHSKHVVAQFNAAGIAAAHVDGETNAQERDEAIERFAEGRTKVLSNVELFGEGFDLPAIEAVILLRPTQSLVVHLQQVGRGLRTHPGKDNVVILDHAGNTDRHGLPDDERQWSLEGRGAGAAAARDGGGRALRKTCRRCFSVQALQASSCAFCGFTFAEGAELPLELEGDLVEVDSALVRQQRWVEQQSAGSLEALTALAQRRGYKQPKVWAQNVYAARRKAGLLG